MGDEENRVLDAISAEPSATGDALWVRCEVGIAIDVVTGLTIGRCKPTVADYPMFTDLIRLARPTHWIKNVFVLLPVPFALEAIGWANSCRSGGANCFPSCLGWLASAW